MNKSSNYSIVLLSYNHPQLTLMAAKSIEDKFENKPHPPMILVHNGSEEKNISLLKKSLIHFDHLVLPHNIGFSGGANAGINRAILLDSQKQRPWVLFITNDCDIKEFPDFINEDHAEILAPVIWSRNSTRIDSIGGLVNLEKGHLKHLKSLEEFDSANKQVNNNQKTYIPGTAFAIKSDTFLKLGGFNQALHTYWEDVDLSLQAHHKKIALGVLNSWHIKHKIGKTCHKMPFYTTFLYQRNRHIVCRKWCQGYFSKIKLELYLIFNWVKLSFKFLTRGKSQNFLILFQAIFSKQKIH